MSVPVLSLSIQHAPKLKSCSAKINRTWFNYLHGSSDCSLSTSDSQSQSFFRRYKSILPTSLNHHFLQTRGSSPRRPDADMGTATQFNSLEFSSWRIIHEHGIWNISAMPQSSHIYCRSNSKGPTLSTSTDNAQFGIQFFSSSQKLPIKLISARIIACIPFGGDLIPLCTYPTP